MFPFGLLKFLIRLHLVHVSLRILSSPGNPTANRTLCSALMVEVSFCDRRLIVHAMSRIQPKASSDKCEKKSNLIILEVYAVWLQLMKYSEPKRV